MDISQQQYPLICLYSLIIGAALAAVYDIIRVSRVAFSPHGRKDVSDAKGGFQSILKRAPAEAYTLVFDVFVFAGDLLFALIAALTVTLFIYHVNDGRVRWFTLAGAAAGFAVYYNTLGRLIMFCAERIVAALRALIRFILSFTLLPLFRFIKWLCLTLLRAVRSFAAALYSMAVRRGLRRDAAGCFIDRSALSAIMKRKM